MNDFRSSFVRNAKLVFYLGICLTVACLIGFAVLLYLMPDNFAGIWGVSHKGLHYWEHTLFGKTFASLSASGFTIWFRVLIFCMYASYLIMIRAASYLPCGRSGLRLFAIMLFGLSMAVFCPPSLSSDAYSYVAYGRMSAIYHINPYFHSPAILMSNGDSAVYILPKNVDHWGHYHLKWDLPTVYGPIWTLLTAFCIKLLAGHSLFSQVLMMRLIEVAALTIAAWSAKCIATRYAAGHETAAMFGVGFNPFLIVEGIVGGHNDLLMISLLMLCGACIAKGRPLRGGICLGLAAGIKFLALAALPWILIETIRKCVKSKYRYATLMTAFAILPIIAAYVPYWHGLNTFSGLLTRSQGLPMLGPPPIAISFLPLITNHTFSPLISHILTILLYECEIITVYLALSLWIKSTDKDGAWLTAWEIMAIAMIFFLIRYWFPWYIIWALSFTVCRRGQLSYNFLAFCLSFALFSSYLYTVKNISFAQNLLTWYVELLVIILLIGNCLYLVNKKNILK